MYMYIYRDRNIQQGKVLMRYGDKYQHSPRRSHPVRHGIMLAIVVSEIPTLSVCIYLWHSQSIQEISFESL
jgi:hypothetical protein